MPIKIVSEIALPLQLFDPTSVLRSLSSYADKKVAGLVCIIKALYRSAWRWLGSKAV